ncbi:MAG: 16S rRNA (cytidine(1402)-2'-O)-methyltransferase [Betaproteobacteria bacterium RBG_16_64_18]|nr:MAG: 16S rRNA (cytidine(1402)-2'-O)-methyltransferase [Betaproteobacteria bacterium RBG_16_64_18]OGA39163.1 MAG: 16S rRNA (cytidine(1402)-2'-O)-methyltransferase [Betaproteobacteria bacterium RIFCSPLOWO2_12_FULL_65_110]
MDRVHGEGRQGDDGTLYVVATPIGNVEDITLRALKVLAAADVIAAEDTRNTASLLKRHGIGKRPVALHQHNEASMAAKVVQWLRQGRSVALVTDAGTPGLSDPGALVVARAMTAGLRVVPIPGANAAVAAFSASGLTDARFLFYGFLPARSSARRAAIAALASLNCALVFYEAPHRILDSVDDLAAVLPGERTIVIARELTKVFESIASLPLHGAPAWMRADANRQRGEFVLIVAGAPEKDQKSRTGWEATLEHLLGELPLAQAVRITCALTGARRKAVYEHALAAAEQRKE